jgi:tetratricopeptide (TPR) repeat protein
MLRTVCVVVLCCIFADLALAAQEENYSNLILRASAEYVSGQISASEASLLAALRLLGPDEDRQRAATLSDLGTLYLTREEFSKTEKAYLECLKIYRRLSDQNSIVRTLTDIGALYSIQRRDADALEVLQRALKMAKAGSGSDPAITVRVLNGLGVAYARQGKYTKAESFLTQASALALKSGISIGTPVFLHNLGVIHFHKREFKKAEDLFLEALNLTEADVGPRHPDLVFLVASLGDVYREAGRCAESEQQYRRALAILETPGPDFSLRVARLLQGLSLTYTKCGRKADADAAMAEAASIARVNLSGRPDMVTIVESYSSTLKNQGKVQEAKALLREAKRARTEAGLVVNVRPF